MKRLLKIRSIYPIETLLHVRSGRIAATRTDLEISLSIATPIPADGPDRDIGIVDTRQWVDAYGLSDGTATITADTIAVGGITLPLRDPTDYPPIPDIRLSRQDLATVSVADLRIAATATDPDKDSGIALRCIQLHASGAIYATDKRRAVRIRTATPARTTLLLARVVPLIDRKAVSCFMAVTDTHVHLDACGTTITQRHVDFKYPDIERVMRVTDQRPVYRFAATDMLATIAIAKTGAKESQIALGADGAVYGHATGTMMPTTPIDTTDRGPVALNYTFLADVCRSIDGPITYSAGNLGHPVHFSDGDRRIEWAVMPMSDPPSRPDTLSSVAPTATRKQTTRKPKLVEIVKGHVWSSESMADEVRQALVAWGFEVEVL